MNKIIPCLTNAQTIELQLRINLTNNLSVNPVDKSGLRPKNWHKYI